MKPLSRRDFLKFSGLALGGLTFSPHLSKATEFEDIDLVRVATTSVSVYAEPSDLYRITGTWFRDDIVHVYEEIVAETPAWNPVWYRVWGGYMHRKRLQKVKVRYNQPLSTVPETGMLAEVTVPYAQAYRQDALNGWQTTYRLYYSSVHWITGIETGPDNQPWYRILDEADESLYFVPAVQMRPIPAEEITPLSPDVSLQVKRIEVSLDTQILTCYENDQVVKRTEISSGLFGLSGQTGEPTNTPVGRFNIQLKMPSKHMGDANLAAGVDDYVLPGVPWVNFFTPKGHAFHGTYWHDNFGVPMSHGCINMRTEEAKWLFRWTMPTAGFDEINPGTLDRKGFGTLVEIL
jgi:hypothetical protein